MPIDIKFICILGSIMQISEPFECLMVFRNAKRPERGVLTRQLAEAVRFELTDLFKSPVFKTGAIDHSATLPWDEIVAI
jgi:hypothetical protein